MMTDEGSGEANDSPGISRECSGVVVTGRWEGQGSPRDAFVNVLSEIGKGHTDVLESLFTPCWEEDRTQEPPSW